MSLVRPARELAKEALVSSWTQLGVLVRPAMCLGSGSTFRSNWAQGVSWLILDRTPRTGVWCAGRMEFQLGTSCTNSAGLTRAVEV